MLLQDIAGNDRTQFFTKQPKGIVCCGRVGNQGDDEIPVFAKLEHCKADQKSVRSAAVSSPVCTFLCFFVCVSLLASLCLLLFEWVSICVMKGKDLISTTSE